MPRGIHEKRAEERLIPHEEAVDAAGPVDAKNAPTGPWKTEDGFPQASTAIIGDQE